MGSDGKFAVIYGSWGEFARDAGTTPGHKVRKWELSTPSHGCTIGYAAQPAHCLSRAYPFEPVYLAREWVYMSAKKVSGSAEQTGLSTSGLFLRCRIAVMHIP